MECRLGFQGLDGKRQRGMTANEYGVSFEVMEMF